MNEVVKLLCPSIGAYEKKKEDENMKKCFRPLG